MALRKSLSCSRAFKFVVSLALLAGAPAIQASTIYDLWDVDRQGLGSLEGWSLVIQDSTGSGNYYFNLTMAGRRQLAVSAGNTEFRIQADLAAVGSTGLYSLDLTYADVNTSIDGAAVNGRAGAGGGGSRTAIGALTGPDGELLPIAISGEPGASLRLTRNASGGYDGESSLVICGDPACASLLDNTSAKLAFSATGRDGGSFGEAGIGGGDQLTIASLSAASVNAPEPTTYLTMGAGLIALGLIKRKVSKV